MRDALRRGAAIGLVMIALSLAWTGQAAAQGGVVRGLLFYSPSCPHCHFVMENTLPPLHEHYGEQLRILLIDITTFEGQQLYLEAIKEYDIPEERRGVPTMVVGQTVLVGSMEIPEQLPAIIESHLESGGLDWPAIPALAPVIAEIEGSGSDPAPEGEEVDPDPPGEIESADPAEGEAAEQTLVATILSRIGRDPIGNSLSIAMLVVMLASVVVLPVRLGRHGRADAPGWGVPLLLILGLGIAGYLAFVETTGSEAVCGPVGDCNTVQSSSYAVLFGVLPVGVSGILGYLLLLGAWILSRIGDSRAANAAGFVLLPLALFGVVFSIYLTFLEPFVIGASCAWCLGSALIMTLLLWLVTKPSKAAWRRLTRPAR